MNNEQYKRREAFRSPKGIFCLSLIVFSFAISLASLLSLIGLIGQPFAGFRIEPTLSISAINESYWTGPKAGLKTYDKIIALDGVKIKTPGEFHQIIKNKGIGSEITYTVAPKGEEKTHDVKVQITRFNFNDFFRSFLIIFLVGFGHLIIGAAAYLVKPYNPISRVHLYMTVAIGLCSTLVSDYDTIMYFPRVWITAVAITGATCLHLGFIFPQKKKIVERFPKVIFIPYIISLLLIITWHYAFRHMGIVGYQAEGIKDLYHLHFEMNDFSLIWSLVVGFIGLIIMIVHSLIKAESRQARNQAKVSLFGAVVAYLPMPILWTIADQILGLQVDMGGALATILWMLFIIFPLSVAYAIVRHKMFDINFIIKQSMVYTSLITLLASAYIVTATGLQQMLTRFMPNYGELTSYMMTTAIILIIFDPIRSTIQNFMDTKFFRKKYDFRTALTDFIETARSTIDRPELINKLTDVMGKTLFPKNIVLFLKHPFENSLFLSYAEGIELDESLTLSLENPAVLKALGLGKKAKTRLMTGPLQFFSDASAAQVPVIGTKKLTANLPQLLGTFEHLQEGITIPLIVKVRNEVDQEAKDEIIGLLSLGEKRSELEYTIEDRQLLQSIVQQLALTLHSAQLAEEVAEKEAIKLTLERARHIQKSMLPTSELELSRFELTGFSESADETGGDYYDWQKLDDDRFIVGIGDVTGHGIDAALIVAMAKSCLFNQAAADPDVSKMMAALNKTINDFNQRYTRDKKRRAKLMTFLYCIFDEKTLSFNMASAGHWYPYLFRQEEHKLEDFSSLRGAFPLGRRPAEKFKCTEHTIQVQPHDLLVMFTDGLHEAMSEAGEEYTMERLEQLIIDNSHLNARQLKHLILKDWQTHLGDNNMDDDVTIVVMQALPEK